MARNVAMLIKTRRKAMALTQEELAAMLTPPVTGMAVSNWERGKEPIPDTRVTDLARVLEVDPRELAGISVRVKDEARQKIAYVDAVQRSKLPLIAQSIIFRMLLTLSKDAGDGLEFRGSLEDIAISFADVSTEQVEKVWPRILASGFVVRLSSATWDIGFVLP